MDVLEPPPRRLHHREDALGMVGRRQLAEDRLTHRLHPMARARQRGFEGPATRGSFQRGARENLADRDPRGQSLLHQPHAFDEREPPPLPTPAEPEITHQGVQRATRQCRSPSRSRGPIPAAAPAFRPT